MKKERRRSIKAISQAQKEETSTAFYNANDTHSVIAATDTVLVVVIVVVMAVVLVVGTSAGNGGEGLVTQPPLCLIS